jgi:hypothetical protein
MFKWLFGKKPKSRKKNRRKLLINKYSAQLRIPKKGLMLIKKIGLVREFRFDDYTIITQAWHESAGFTRIIGDWNFWGIKKPRGWRGKVHRIKTHEYRNGKKKPYYLDFIDFKNIDEAINWWMGLIRNVYKNAYKHRDDPPRFFDGLIKGGNVESEFNYATHQDADGNYIYDELLFILYQQLVRNSILTRFLKVV